LRSAALDLFYERGFRSTSVRDITSACRLTSGAFYNHFPSKDSLLYEIVQSTHDLCDDYLFRGLSRGQGPRGQLWHIAFAIAEFHAVNAKQARVTSQDFRQLPEPQLSEIRGRRRRVRAMFEHVLTNGVATRDFDAPRGGEERSVRLLATSITNMAIRISEWYVPNQGMDVREIAAFHGDLAIRMTKHNGEVEFAV
jgi:AcrR family transcriptional regulator